MSEKEMVPSDTERVELVRTNWITDQETLGEIYERYPSLIREEIFAITQFSHGLTDDETAARLKNIRCGMKGAEIQAVMREGF